MQATEGARSGVLLLTVDTNTYFRSQFALGEALRQLSGRRLTFVFTHDYPQREEHIKTLESAGHGTWVCDTCGPNRGKRNARALAWRFLRRALAPGAELWHSVSLRHQWKRFLKRQHDPTLVLPAQNRFDQILLADVAMKMSIPTILCPLWMAGPQEVMESIKHASSQSTERLANRFTAALFPDWVMKEHATGRRFLPVPWGKVIAFELLKLRPDKPWVLHSGPCDIICVESISMSLNAAESGLSTRKLAVTGSVFHDTMALFAPRQSAQRLQSRDSRRFEICTALPPDMFASREQWCSEFRDYESLVTGWLRGLSALKETRVIVSVHPTAEFPDSFRGLFPEFTWTEAPIELLLPNCDLFVASISATIQWARACGLPVVNYDVYQYGYSDYVGDPGVMECTTFAQFEAALQDCQILWRQHRLGKVDGSSWGLLDGKASERILACIDIAATKRIESEDAVHPATMQQALDATKQSPH